MLAMVIPGLLLGGGVRASAGAGATIGPVQINPVGHPGLCWQATGDGAPILLEDCDPGLKSQQWSLTPGGVMMNGIGYCLEAQSGQPDGVPLDTDFVGECGLSGRLPADARSGGSYTLTARVVVRGTSQLHGTVRTSAPVTVSVRAPAPVTRGAGVPLAAVVLGALLVGGGVLVGFALRRWSVTATDYQGRRRRPAHRLLRVRVRP